MGLQVWANPVAKSLSTHPSFDSINMAYFVPDMSNLKVTKAGRNLPFMGLIFK
jgi:hypothetical protein